MPQTSNQKHPAIECHCPLHTFLPAGRCKTRSLIFNFQPSTIKPGVNFVLFAHSFDPALPRSNSKPCRSNFQFSIFNFQLSLGLAHFIRLTQRSQGQKVNPVDRQIAGFLFVRKFTSKLEISPKQKIPPYLVGFAFSGDLAGARTQDPLLKREMLYQLSYQVIMCLI